MKFSIKIEETLAKTVEVEAETAEEALQIAEYQYYDEYWILDSSNIQDVTFNHVEEDD